MRWTKTDIEILRENYPSKSKQEILDLFPGRTWKSLRIKASRLDLKQDSYLWSEAEIRLLKQRYEDPSESKESLIKLFNRPWAGICHKAQRLGLRSARFWTDEEKQAIA